MPRATEQFTAQERVLVKTKLEFICIEPGLFAYRQQLSSVRDEPGTGTTQVPEAGAPKGSWTGLVNEEGREALLAGKHAQLLDLAIVSHTQLEGLRTQGWAAMEKRLYANMPKPFWQLLLDDETLGPDNFVRLDFSSHMAFDRHGKALPVALEFTYLENQIDESTHDLHALAVHLLARGDTLVHAAGQAGHAATSPDTALFPIPHYNARPGHTQSLNFLWQPTQDDYSRVWEACKGKCPAARLREKVLALDVLDIEQFRLPTLARTASLRP